MRFSKKKVGVSIVILFITMLSNVTLVYAGWIDDKFETVTNLLRSPLQGLIEGMYGVFNLCCKTTLDLIGITPKEFNNGLGWDKIADIMPIFTGVALSLVVTFFLAGFFRECINIKQEFTVEQIIKILARLGIAQGIVASTMPIAEAICKSAGLFAKAISGTYSEIVMPNSISNTIESANFGEALVALIVGAMLFVVAVVLGGTMLYTIYFRIYKILIVIPFGALAFSTISGGGSISSTATAYLKTFLAYTGEIIVMAVAIILSSAILNGGFSFGYTGGSDLVKLLLIMLEAIFSFAVITTAVKGAEGTLRRALNL